MNQRIKDLFTEFKERAKIFLKQVEEDRIKRIELIYGLKDKEMKNQLLERFEEKTEKIAKSIPREVYLGR